MYCIIVWRSKIVILKLQKPAPEENLRLAQLQCNMHIFKEILTLFATERAVLYSRAY